jgi:hypothetical protein
VSSVNIPNGFPTAREALPLFQFTFGHHFTAFQIEFDGKDN